MTSKTIENNNILRIRDTDPASIFVPKWHEVPQVDFYDEGAANAWFQYLWKDRRFSTCVETSENFKVRDEFANDTTFMSKVLVLLMKEGLEVFYINKISAVLYDCNTVVQITNSSNMFYVHAVFSPNSYFPRVIRKLFDSFLEDYTSKVPRNSAYLLTKSGSSLQITAASGIKGCELQHCNYSSETLMGYRGIVESICSEDPNGRLNLLTGPPGTGKTHLIKALMNDTDSSLVFIPPNMTDNLVGPELITCLLNYRVSCPNMVLVFEDADSVIKPREDGNMDFISSLLNVTSGIIADALNIHVICTSNIDASQVDPALTRTGRLNKHLKLEALDCNKATEAYANIAKKHGVEPMTIYEDMILSDIYAMVLAEKEELCRTESSV